jgi:RimJ/RimL family protein N-acetyltransferase
MGDAQINLRAITEADLPQFVIWRSDPEVMQFLLGEATDTTLAGIKEWFGRVASPDCLEQIWAIEAAGRLIGCCSLRPEANKPVASFGVYIGDKNIWGKGYGTAAVREVLRVGFEELGLHRIHLGVFPDNPRAIRCYEKCGFRHEGLQRQSRFKGGRWQDLITMAILRDEWQAQARSSQTGDWSI